MFTICRAAGLYVSGPLEYRRDIGSGESLEGLRVRNAAFGGS